MHDKIKVLQILGGGQAIGGVEKMLLNYYSHIDRKKIQFDFCFYRESSFPLLDKEYRECLNESKIYELHSFKGKSTLIGYIKAISKVKRIIKQGYDIVHINSGRPALLLTGMIAAKKAKAKAIITHSHSTLGSTLTGIRKKLHTRISNYLIKHSNYLFACSFDAGEYMFGKKALQQSNFLEIRNAINVSPYLFNENIRKKEREFYGIANNTIVYGHVGRFSEEKNHLLLIDIFEQIHLVEPDSLLWLVGDGSLKEATQKKVHEKGLDSHVTFFGERDDVNNLMQAMDVFLFPSKYEGLSVTLIEAQSASLPVYASDSISKEHSISSNFVFYSLNKTPEEWAKKILETKKTLRVNMKETIRNSGYDIAVEAKKLESVYLNIKTLNEN